MSRPLFEKVSASSEANIKSRKLIPFVRMAENHGGVSTPYFLLKNDHLLDVTLGVSGGLGT